MRPLRIKKGNKYTRREEKKAKIMFLKTFRHSGEKKKKKKRKKKKKIPARVMIQCN